MKMSKNIMNVVVFFFSTFLMMGCGNDDDADQGKDSSKEPDGAYWVQLFDGDNFTDDNIIIDEEGEYADLSDLPGSDGKDWTDEADSFKVGDSTTVVAWTKRNFEGDSKVYEAGKYKSVDEPYSMKIYFGDHKHEDGGGEGVAACSVQLFDGDNFKDDHITIKEPGEYENLDDLPGSDGKNWTDEADSFKVGKNTTVTVWTETDFKGDSKVYEAGDYKSVDEPYSMKIECVED